MKTKMYKSKRTFGSVLPLVVMMVILVSIIGIGLVRLGQNSRVQAAKMVSEFRARAAADAGLSQAIHQMNHKLQTEAVWNNASLPAANDLDLSNCNAQYGYNVTGDPINGFEVVSTGTSAFAQKTVRCILWKESTWFGIGVKEGVDLKVGITLDTDPLGGKFSIRTNSTTNDAIKIKAGVRVPGDLIVGPGGIIDDVVSIKDTTVIDGDVWAAKKKLDFPPVTVPDLGSSQGAINDPFVIVWDSPVYDINGVVEIPTIVPHASLPVIASSATIIDDGTYDNIRLPNSGTMLIVGNCTLCVKGETILGNSAQIIVTPGSSLALYLGGDMEAKNSNGIDNLNTDPRALVIYGTDTCRQIDLKAKGDVFFGAVYAPEAHLCVYAKNELAGAFTGKSFSLKNSTHFTFVSALVDSGIDEPQTYLVQRWWEE